MSSTLHFGPDAIDKMKLYMAIVYVRRLKKGGFLGGKGSTGAKEGTSQDFVTVFGNNTGP